MLVVSFTLGLFGSLHCLFMCGPLVLGVGKSSQKHGLGLFLHSMGYNLSRVLAYVLLGVIFGMLGKGFSLIGFQQMLSIITGVLLLVLVLASLDLERFIFRFSAIRNLYSKYSVFLQRKISVLAQSHPLTLGFLNGLLPCGMVYIALAGALGTASIYEGAIFMLSFGLGTLPMILLIMTSSSSLFQLSGKYRKYIIPIGQAALGIYMIIRGSGSALPDGWF